AESRGLWLEGFVVKELSETPSNWRSEKDLDTYLRENGVIGIQGVDTRALTKHIREAGAMKSVISTTDLDPGSLVAKAHKSQGRAGIDLVQGVTCDQPFTFADQDGPTVVVLDYGVKYSILRQLREAGCTVTVVPAHAAVDEILAYKPAGVLLSNGPGDPAAVTYAIDTVCALLKIGTIPLFGICLGQQILGLALGGKTFKMKFGHHGSNHPVKDLSTGRIDITVQNHGFCIDPNSLDTDTIEVTHINLNDHSLEGIRHRTLPVFSVQFHPEAGPGPHDARYLFKRFVKTMND
ncbi:MAG: glutamine-hydrolyzing carbamoyl-phosphate synthase small subunit, partial [Deltaproteobacteria bacterium]|nr:glutamine-hydrolyzing carbamoyl-phosphate synthase small subunit [Deltaproteobacteria bacterium]